MWSRSAERQRRRLAGAYTECFATPAGELVLRDLLRICGVLETSHQPADAYETAFREGRRSVALEILGRLRWSEAEMVELAKERTAETLGVEREDAAWPS